MSTQTRLKLGQYFIYTLRVMEYYFRVVAQNAELAQSLLDASLAAEQKSTSTSCQQAPWTIYDQQWLDKLLEGLYDHRSVRDGVVPPKSSTLFSSVKLGELAGIQPATLNHYMQIFGHKWDYYYRSQRAGFKGDPSLGRNPSIQDIETFLCLRTKNKMSKIKYTAADTCVTPHLDKIVSHAVYPNGFFKNLNLFYYQFFRWHRIDYLDIEHVEDAGIKLPYSADLKNLLGRIEQSRVSFNAADVAVLLDEFFSYYADFVSNPDVATALAYSYAQCHKYNSPGQTVRLFKSLWRVQKAFYSVENLGVGKAGGAASGNTTSNTAPGVTKELSAKKGVQLREWPRVPNKMRANTQPGWDSSFESAFFDVVQHDSRSTDALKILQKISQSSQNSFSANAFSNIQMLLTSANMTLANENRFNSGIHHYDVVDEQSFPSFSGLRFGIPYKPLIDSTPSQMYKHDDFDFAADRRHLAPDLEVGPFEPLLDQLYEEARIKAMNIGYPGISEPKIYIHQIKRQTGKKPCYKVQLGKTDYFTGVGRKDLFSSFLVPSSGNLGKPLAYLLKHNALPKFVAGSKAKKVQDFYNSGFTNEPESVKAAKVFNGDAQLEQEVRKNLSYEINRLYQDVIDNSCRLSPKGQIEFQDNGSSYTGCGTFILTGDSFNGHDQPYLLLEKRWRVSEENDNICYPSGGSCDFYDPDDHVPYEQEQIKDLEADPFKTAVREIREELNLKVSPKDLQLVSFGIDVNRNLQQFSFLYESTEPVKRILERSRYASSSHEGYTFFIPFSKAAILSVMNNYHIESSALYSIMRIMELKADRLWDDSFCK